MDNWLGTRERNNVLNIACLNLMSKKKVAVVNGRNRTMQMAIIEHRDSCT